jgi:signal transduction histidine kinase
MKTPPNLRRYIAVSLGGIILVMIVAYTLLVLHAFSSSVKDLISYDLTLKARNFARDYRENAESPLPKDRYLTAYMNPAELPQWLTDSCDVENLAHGRPEMGNMTGPHIHGGEEFFFLAMAYDLHDNNRLYLVETYTEKDEIPGSFSNIRRAMYITLAFGIGFILLVGVILRFFFFRISTPVNALGDWANSLTSKSLERPHPDFRFEEINQLADLIQHAVGDLHQALQREQFFLNSASHELRTPIAVIRTNLDLLQRLQPSMEERTGTSFQRIRRAVDNMRGLTETLLWLSRKEENMPPAETVDIYRTVNELVRENRYLLKGKDVELDMDMSPATAIVPRVALVIAMENLIRNAFQHVHKGKIEIRLTGTAIVITNTEPPEGEVVRTSSEYGFGLGLMLVEQISRKLGLSYENRSVPGGHEATLSFPAVGPSATG